MLWTLLKITVSDPPLLRPFMESHSLTGLEVFHSFLGSSEGAFSGHSGNTDGHHWGVCTPLLARWERFFLSKQTDLGGHLPLFQKCCRISAEGACDCHRLSPMSVSIVALCPTSEHNCQLHSEFHCHCRSSFLCSGLSGAYLLPQYKEGSGVFPS